MNLQVLTKNEIPLSGRLMSLADVYGALISKRIYKLAFSHEKAVRIIKESRGYHFDPDIVDLFLRNQRQFQAIAARYTDPEEYPAAIQAAV